MKRLYLCELKVEAYVYAENEADAADIASMNQRDIVGDHYLAFHWVCEPVDYVPHDWKTSLPYSDGDSEERACEQILLDMPAEEEAEREAERQRAEWESHPKLLEV